MRLIVSYLTLRRVVGVLGIALPVLVALGSYLLKPSIGLKPSISSYYESPMRDVFVGTLFVIGWFLFAYKGYEDQDGEDRTCIIRISDDRAGDLACILALGVALFPTTSNIKIIHYLHVACAAALFLILAYFSICLFTKTKAGATPTPGKERRNRIYKTCGWIMIGCIVLIPIYYFWGKSSFIAVIQPVFWLEALALWAFGWSWFIKGETLLKD